MKRQDSQDQVGRREFLKTAGFLGLGLGAAALLPSEAAEAADQMNPDSKPWRGLFPIGQTPFTADDKLDLDCLAAEVKFCNRGRVPGFIWPQYASGWTTLTEKERMDGAEAIVAAGKGGKTSLVIGVQALGGDIDAAVRYAKHAAQLGADGLISLPPGAGVEELKPTKKVSDQDVLNYFKTVGAATDLPLMVQSNDDMSVELIVALYQQVPTLKGLKDEAGDPLTRLPEFKRRTDNKLVVFNADDKTVLDGLRRGFDGYVPQTGLADICQAVFELWGEGKHKEAFDMFGRIEVFQTIRGAMQYLLTARGVFKETTTVRDARRIFGAEGVMPDETQKKVIREELAQFLGPHLRA
jgi:1-pyrroline-4-hydroxy-2-carboxylate deaminase